MSNKTAAKEFLTMAATGDVQAAYDRFIAPNFIHHNQYFKGDRQSLLNAMKEAHQSHSNKGIEIKQTIEEGDRVMTLSEVIRKDPAAPSIAVVHIFRFENGKVAELWDLGQVLDRNMPNENGAF